MKQRIDGWIDDSLNDEGDDKWTLQLENSDLKVWYRWKGTEMNRDLPIARAEFYFPNIEDPLILKAALTEFKNEWDTKSESIEELKQFSNKNLIVQRTVRKPVMNT